MGKWLGYTVELCFDGQWFNIDQWHRSASGRLRHRYLHAAPERDILSSPYDELALLKKRIRFSDLAASTQDIICAENPAFERSSFGAWDFFIWGSLADLEALLQKPVKNEDDECISKTLLKELVFKIQDQISFFSKLSRIGSPTGHRKHQSELLSVNCDFIGSYFPKSVVNVCAAKKEVEHHDLCHVRYPWAEAAL